MGTLADRVEVSRRFKRSVRVDDLAAAGALDGFRCPKSIAASLESMARQVAHSGQGAFTWTGPYGCGKSSLAVALAALVGPRPGRKAARSAIGCNAAGIERVLDPDRRGRIVVPVVGRRASAETVITDALENASRSYGVPALGGDLLARLRTLADDRSHAGVLLIVDEMGKFLEEASSGKVDVHFFQDLAEVASRSGGRLVVVGILHQAFDDYAVRLGRETRDEWLKIQGRWSDVPLNVVAEEQIELIALAVASKGTPASNLTLSVAIADAVRSRRAGIDGDLAQRLDSCWPLHPVVTCLLGPMSRRRFGQNQRSVFGFLNSAEPFGFQDWLSGARADTEGTYGPADLWDYLRANLEPAILASPDGHRWSLAVEAVERCASKASSEAQLDLTKAIALLDLFKDRSGLPASRPVLASVVSGLTPERLDACLEDLQAWSIVIFRRHVDSFAIFAGSDFDIDGAVAEARTRQPGVDLARLRSLASLQPVLAKRHYHLTGSLRWFEVDIAAIGDGAERVAAFRPRQGASGLFLLLVASEAEGDAKARRLWLKAADAAHGWPVAVGWTRDSFMIRELAAELLALEAVRAESDELRGDDVARREVAGRIARLSSEIEDRLANAFEQARWTWRGLEGDRMAPIGGMNAIASALADARYPAAPRICNELLNRIRPSSNAVAAQKELLKAMVERQSEPRLGFEGYPAAGGLYVSLIEATGLHGLMADDPPAWGFREPDDGAGHGLAPIWKAAQDVFEGAAGGGARMSDLYDVWRSPPYGVRDGLLPVFALAWLLSKTGFLSVYLDGVFQSRSSTMLVDRLTQDPSSVRLRWTRTNAFNVEVLHALSGVVDRLGVMPRSDASASEPIEVARALVGVVVSLPGWVGRTAELSPTASKVRNLAKIANDPNKFLLDDLPAAFALDADDAASVGTLVAVVEAGLTELVEAFPRMLRDFEGVMLQGLRVRGTDELAMADLRRRCQVVRGLTGDFKLDAFATRLSSYHGALADLEGIAGLVIGKPAREFVDRDVDQARVAVATLAQEFVKSEAFAHVKGREDGRVSMAIFIGDPSRSSPVTPNIDVAVDEMVHAIALADAMERLVDESSAGRDVALAALAELGARIAEGRKGPRSVKAAPAKATTRKRLAS